MADVKTNYKNKYSFNMHCRICDDKTEVESEKHLLKCSQIIQNYSHPTLDLLNAKYEDIFSENIEEQTKIAKTYDVIFKIRARLLNQS